MERASRITSQSAISDNPALALVAELEQRGLIAQAQGHGVVWARNPAGDPKHGDPRGRALSPRLQQEVVCRPLGSSLWWLWAWSGVERDSPAELEPLCPAWQVETAAERIAHVLAVPHRDEADDDRA
jgi:hypothetical protein